MIDRTCSHEAAVLASYRAGDGRLDESARAHVAGCAACALALEAERATKELSAVFAAEARLVPVEIVVLRARLRSRREETERSLRPLELWQRFAGVAIAAGLLVAAILFGPMFGDLGSAPSAVDPKLAVLVLGLGSLLALPFAGRRGIA